MDRPAVDGPVATDLTRRVGSLHLAASGAVSVVIGAVVGVLVIEGLVFDTLVAVLSTVVDEVTLVANTQLLLTATGWGGPVLSLVLLSVGAAQLYGGWLTYRARGWRYGLGSGLLGAVNLVAVPLVIVALLLLVLSRDQFAKGASRTGEIESHPGE